MTDDLCVICGELPATVGDYCARCADGLDDETLEELGLDPTCEVCGDYLSAGYCESCILQGTG